MVNDRMLEVRCCCTPDKLLGWLPAPQYGRAQKFLLRGESPLGFLRLEVCRFSYFGRIHNAFKAESVDISVLRQIPQFIEASEVERSIDMLRDLRMVISMSAHLMENRHYDTQLDAIARIDAELERLEALMRPPAGELAPPRPFHVE